MQNISKKLDFRPLAQVDQTYMENALIFLDEYKILETIEQIFPHTNFDLSRMHLEDFKEWLAIVGSPSKNISLNSPDQKLVSFSFALMHFQEPKSFPLMIADLRLLLESSEAKYYELVFLMFQSLVLLDKIANR